MKTLTDRFALLIATLALALVAPISSAHANSGTTHSLDVDPIHVSSDGQSYTGVARFWWRAQISIDAGRVGRIKRREYWPELNVEGQDNLSLRSWASTKSYGVGDRPKTFSGPVGNLVSPNLEIKSWAIEACDRHASALRAAGRTDAQIFGRERKIAVQIIDRWNIDFSDLDKFIVEATYWFTEIVCGPAPGPIAPLEKKPTRPPRPGATDLAVPFSVSAAKIRVKPNHTTGPCPMDLDVTATLTAVGKGTASFRVVHNGAPGPVRQVTFGKGGKKKSTATFEVGRPSSGPGFEAAGPGGSGGSGGGGSGPTFTTSTNPNQHTGHFEIHVVKPNNVRSDPSHYSVNCVQQAVPTGPTTLRAASPGGDGGQPGGAQRQSNDGRTSPPGAPIVRLSPWKGSTCTAVHLNIEPGVGAAPQTYQAVWQRFDPSAKRWVATKVGAYGQLAGPTVDARVPRPTFEAAGRWRVQVRSRQPRGTGSSDWAVVKLERCGS